MAHIAIVSVTTVIFGVASLLMISKARNRLSEGSIRRYLDNFAVCLAFIVVFSIWQTVRSIVGVDSIVEETTHFLTYPEYVFIIFAYIAFIIASFRVAKISEEFGFKEEGKKIEQLIKERSATDIHKDISEIKSGKITRKNKK